MKKNSMRIACLLLALTLATCCFVGGTFAKYQTTTGGDDNARVAYWGFNATEKEDIDLFDMSYASDTDTYTGNTVEDADENLVAPGTTNTATFKFVNLQTGDKAPEVAYTLTVDVTGQISPELEEKLFFTLDGVRCETMEELVSAIKALSGDETGTKVYAPNEAPEAFKNASEHTVSWTWEIGGVDENGEGVDNAIGNMTDAPTISLEIGVTATQID